MDKASWMIFGAGLFGGFGAAAGIGSTVASMMGCGGALLGLLVAVKWEAPEYAPPIQRAPSCTQCGCGVEHWHCPSCGAKG